MSVNANSFQIETKSVESVEEHMRSPEFQDFNRRCGEYLARIDAEAIKDLSDTDREWYARWRKGETIDWSEIPDAAHSAILWVCNQGGG